MGRGDNDCDDHCGAFDWDYFVLIKKGFPLAEILFCTLFFCIAHPVIMSV